MKYIFVFFALFFYFQTFAKSWEVLDSCEYKWDLEMCIEANKKWTNREIEDFVCISSGDPTKILSQIILDKEFKKIDKEAESYLKKLESNKNEFFWPESSRSLVEGIDEIEQKFSFTSDKWLWIKYFSLCKWWVLQKTLDCYWDNWIPSVNAEPYFLTSTCENFVKTKLLVYASVWYDVLKLNKTQVDKDQKKKSTQVRRDKYDKLLELVTIHLWYMERMRKKWPSKTKNPM